MRLTIAEGAPCTLYFAMQDLRMLLAASLLLTACSRSPAGDKVLRKIARPSVADKIDQAVAQAYAPDGISLDGAQRRRIGMKIWQNESAGKVSGLTHWNEGGVSSLRIGHFIWYPRGFNGRWTETWPEFVGFARDRASGAFRHGPPADCPNNRAAFNATSTGAAHRPRRWLAANIDVQTEFIMAKSRAALPRIMAAAPAGQRARIKANYGKVAATEWHLRLIDYVNFKGDGTIRERYNGQGWGLMWVLMEMGMSLPGSCGKEFAAAAKRRLDLRVLNSPPRVGKSAGLPAGTTGATLRDGPRAAPTFTSHGSGITRAPMTFRFRTFRCL